MNEANGVVKYSIQNKDRGSSFTWSVDNHDGDSNLAWSDAENKVVVYRAEYDNLEFRIVRADTGEVVNGPYRPTIPASPALPTDDASRKRLPVFRGPVMYFPNALLAVAAVCKAGNDQHNPGQPMHWAREKSTEHMDTALRHMMDHGLGNTRDIDGTWHLAKAVWRLMAELQLTIEREELK